MGLETIFRFENERIFDSRVNGVRFRYRIVKQILESLEREKREHLDRVKVIESYIPELQKWLSETEGLICQNCNGIGSIRIQIFEDESRTEVCSTCRGTGISKKVQSLEYE